jgi:hypothetical protein
LNGAPRGRGGRNPTLQEVGKINFSAGIFSAKRDDETVRITTQKFPFNVKIAQTLKIREPHVITVTGKVFYDIAHA